MLKTICASGFLLGTLVVMPSPDGKFVLVQVVKKGRRTIFVIGSDGATLAELDCGPS